MNRREHYLEAERMIETATRTAEDAVMVGMDSVRADRFHRTLASQLALAQVHATLAMVPARWIAGESYGDEHEAIAAAEPGPAPRSKETL